ncbi:MAG: hypothetical protein LC130_08810 [Bryobacterales bacterium]|nr:hypothetical protein [Bryobacterales bacterium]
MSLGTLWRLENHYGTANNGNVVKQVVAVPGMMTVTERYEYDGVNRLKTAAEYATDRVAAQCPDSGSVCGRGMDRRSWANVLLFRP